MFLRSSRLPGFWRSSLPVKIWAPVLWVSTFLIAVFTSYVASIDGGPVGPVRSAAAESAADAQPEAAPSPTPAAPVVSGEAAAPVPAPAPGAGQPVAPPPAPPGAGEPVAVAYTPVDSDPPGAGEPVPPSSQPTSGSGGDGSGSGGGSSSDSGGSDDDGYTAAGADRPSVRVRFTPASATTGQYSDEVVLEARLREGREPVRRAELSFELTGSSAGTVTARTDGRGIASVALALTEQPGSYELTVTYAADRREVKARMPFEVTQEDSVLSLTTQSSPEGKSEDDREDKGKDESKVVAELFDADSSAPVAGRTVELYVDDELIASATTEDDGTATFELPPRYRDEEDLVARFTGDGFYLASEATTES